MINKPNPLKVLAVFIALSYVAPDETRSILKYIAKSKKEVIIQEPSKPGLIRSFFKASIIKIKKFWKFIY